MLKIKEIKVSIIIPFFNHGDLIFEAIESTSEISDLIEIIIVNDGSTDIDSLNAISTLKSRDFQVINQHNQGLGAARNSAIKASRGSYILPLDSDNKITPDYVRKGISILDADKKIGVVYGNPIWFGKNNKSRVWKVEDYNEKTIKFANYIDACAIFRKELWHQLGGYDEKMPHMGHEDWDFWIRASGTSFKFHHVNEALYYYRISENSMITNIDRKKYVENFGYILRKNSALYGFYVDKYLRIISATMSLSPFNLKILVFCLRILKFLSR